MSTNLAVAADVLPPQDLAAEQSVLGAMMLSTTAVAEVTEILAVRDFYRPAHAVVFTAALRLFEAGDPVDAVAVADELLRRGELNRVGGAPYLHTLIQTVPTAANAAYYADIVAEKATMRRLIEAGTRIVQLGYAGADGAGVEEVVDLAQATLFDATSELHAGGTGPITGEEAAAAVLDDLDDTTPRDLVTTGLLDLDDILGGLEPGELTVVCGRPGHGKTLLALQIARHAVLEQDKHAVIFSLEMSHKLVMQRMLAAIPTRGVDLAKIRKLRDLEPQDRQRLAGAHARLHDAPLWIDDASYQTTGTIRTTLRRHIHQHGTPHVVVIDYLGLIKPTGRAERRDLEVAEITRDLKILAGQLAVPIVLVHQLNRQSARRADKRPQLDDLRDSGAVEADAFAVIGVHTPGVDDPDSPRLGETDIYVLKNRQGRDGRVTAAWMANLGRLADLANP